MNLNISTHKFENRSRKFAAKYLMRREQQSSPRRPRRPRRRRMDTCFPLKVFGSF